MNYIVGNVDVYKLTDERFGERVVRVWTPENYAESGISYPVIYMHDGQNLFDEASSYAGEWQADETMTSRIKDGKRAALVVGIDNGLNRFNEYCPNHEICTVPFTPTGVSWRENISSPCGEEYARFIVEKVIPFVNARYRVQTGKENTFVGGSSMGGLLSFYMAIKYREVFGGGVIYSPAFLAYTKKGFSEFLDAMKIDSYDGRLSIYVGGKEFEGEFVEFTERAVERLVSLGKADNIEYTYVPDNIHIERAWREVFPDSLDFLL